MENTILKDIPFSLNISSTEFLKRKLKIRDGGSSYNSFGALIKEAQKLAQLKGLYRPAYIEDRTEEAVRVEDKWLTSRVLAVNLIQVERIFIFTATCGLELDLWAGEQKNILHAYWAGAIKEMALQTAIMTLKAHIEEHYHPGRTSMQLPGSLEDFPLSEQEVIFALLGDTRTAVGVTLLSSLMLSPSHSVSGIIFPTAVNFESCMLCTRDNCRGRRVPYDPNLYERKYSKSAKEADT